MEQRVYEAGCLHNFMPEYKGKSFSVKHSACDWRQAALYNMRAEKPLQHISPGTYTVMYRPGPGDVIMSDTPMEERTNAFFVKRARGHVLIGGLGFGWIVHNIQQRPDVLSVTVVELNPEVIAYTTKHAHFNEKVKIVQGNIDTWQPELGARYDTVYFDIWNDVSSSHYGQMLTLRKRAKLWLSPKAWIGCWCELQTRCMFKDRNGPEKLKSFINSFKTA